MLNVDKSGSATEEREAGSDTARSACMEAIIREIWLSWPAHMKVKQNSCQHSTNSISTTHRQVMLAEERFQTEHVSLSAGVEWRNLWEVCMASDAALSTGSAWQQMGLLHRWKEFYLNLPVSQQNSCVWATDHWTHQTDYHVGGTMLEAYHRLKKSHQQLESFEAHCRKSGMTFRSQ